MERPRPFGGGLAAANAAVDDFDLTEWTFEKIATAGAAALTLVSKLEGPGRATGRLRLRR